MRMGIKPALGWLGLLLFTTTAQAEGTRDLLDRARASGVKAAPASVTRKTKAPGPIVLAQASGQRGRGGLTVIESSAKPRADYAATTYTSAPLDSAVAKERGLDKGLVQMVFEKQRRPAFRIEREHIRRLVRLASEQAIATASHGTPTTGIDHVDVLETDDGVVLVDTIVENAGKLVTSDVYVFPKTATLDQRIGAIESVAAPKRARLREALVTAEWSVHARAEGGAGTKL